MPAGQKQCSSAAGVLMQLKRDFCANGVRLQNTFQGFYCFKFTKRMRAGFRFPGYNL